MSKEIIVNKGKQTRIAIVENGELAELFIENQEHERTIGNIFLGRIRRIMPSIQAAFVDIGQKQDAFLHFTDLIENVEDWLSYAQSDSPIIGKFKASYSTRPIKKKRRHPNASVEHHANRRDDDDGDGDDDDLDNSEHHHIADAGRRDQRKSAQHRQHSRHEGGRDSRDDHDDAPYVDPTTILKKDQLILVKISKEPIANKGSRITTDISLAGRFLVLVPMANYVAVSKKILSFKERRRLRALARSLLPEGFGVIVRTVADGRSAKALDIDLNLLIEKWKKLEEKLLLGPKAPIVVHEDVNMVSSIMRDLFTDDYDRIVLDDQRLYRNIKGYVQAIAPDMVADVKFHQGPEPIFEKAGIAQAVEEAFDSRVNMPSGGYLFIETTEAMHVIDVNSGRAGRGLSQEENSVRINTEAAKILAKQVRLRDLGGIIVVDFIDMRNERNRRKVYETLKTEFRKDRAVTKVLTMSDFGLIQITRQRLRPSITKTFSFEEGTEGSPRQGIDHSSGSQSSREFVPRRSPKEFQEELESWFSRFKASGRSGKVALVLHPFTASYIDSGLLKKLGWYFSYGVRVEVVEESSIDPMAFRFIESKSKQDITSLPKLKEAPKPEVKPAASKSPSSPKVEGNKAGGSQGDPRSKPDHSDRRDDRRGGSGDAKPNHRDAKDDSGSRSSGSRGRGARDSEFEAKDAVEREDRMQPFGGGKGRDGRGRDNRGRGGRGRDGRDDGGSMEERDQVGRGSEGRGRDDRNRDALGSGDRNRDERGRDERGRDEKGRDDRNRDVKGSEDRGRDEKGRDVTNNESKGRSPREIKDAPKKVTDGNPVNVVSVKKDETFKPVELKAESKVNRDVSPISLAAAEADETVKTPIKATKPKAQKAPSSKSAKKARPADETEISEAVSMVVSKPVQPAPKSPDKSTSPPSRHRLEKYDFSQGALSRAKPPQENVSAMKDTDVAKLEDEKSA